MADFERALAKVLRHEGGYDNDPADPGGETNYGITVAEAREDGYEGEMRDLPVDLVEKRYRAKYWDELQGDKLPDQAIAEELFDSGVNIGVARVVMFLQDTLNVLNKDGALYAEVPVTGHLGPITLETLARALGANPRYREAILRSLDSLQCAYYIGLGRVTPGMDPVLERKRRRARRFMPGWILNRCGA